MSEAGSGTEARRWDEGQLSALPPPGALRPTWPLSAQLTVPTALRVLPFNT